MKVLHLISTNVFSGAENVACQIIKAFGNSKDYEMVYASVIGPNKNSLIDRNIPYIDLKHFDFINVKRVINIYKPDIIHAHDIKASIIASFFEKKCKIISHVHNNHENMRNLNLKTFLFNYVSKKLEKIIWVSKSALEQYYFRKKISNKSLVLYNAINSEEINNKADMDNNEYNYDIIYLGRLTYQKNPQRLISILNEVIKEKKDLKVAIVGNGDLEYEIRNKIKELELQENIKLLGFVSNPYKILKSSKFMILTSRFEGTPMCALEAMALGKPIVSTPTDGLVDIIEHEENGILSNSDDELIENIINLLNDPKKLKKMSTNAEKKFNELCNIEKYKNEIEKIYE